MLKAAIMIHLFIYLFPLLSAPSKPWSYSGWHWGIPLQSTLAIPYYNPGLSLTAHRQKTQTATPIRKEVPWTRKVVSVGLSLPKTHMDLPSSELHTDVALEGFFFAFKCEIHTRTHTYSTFHKCMIYWSLTNCSTHTSSPRTRADVSNPKEGPPG